MVAASLYAGEGHCSSVPSPRPSSLAYCACGSARRDRVDNTVIGNSGCTVVYHDDSGCSPLRLEVGRDEDAAPHSLDQNLVADPRHQRNANDAQRG
jgi:hypothetical protein